MLRFWTIALIGNFIGALIFGWLISAVSNFGPSTLGLLNEIVERKMSVASGGGVEGWGRVVLSGVMATGWWGWLPCSP